MLTRTRNAVQAKFARNMQVIQMVNIALRKGKIKLPRLYKDLTSENDDYVVADYIDPDNEPQYQEVNRMCNAMSVKWASTWGEAGDKGFWEYSAEQQKQMAEWVATDGTQEEQANRVADVLRTVPLDLETFKAVLLALENDQRARGVLASADHAVAFVVRGGRIQIYDSMNGEVSINESVASFVKNLDGYVDTYYWNSFACNVEN